MEDKIDRMQKDLEKMKQDINMMKKRHGSGDDQERQPDEPSGRSEPGEIGHSPGGEGQMDEPADSTEDTAPPTGEPVDETGPAGDEHPSPASSPPGRDEEADTGGDGGSVYPGYEPEPEDDESMPEGSPDGPETHDRPEEGQGQAIDQAGTGTEEPDQSADDEEHKSQAEKFRETIMHAKRAAEHGDLEEAENLYSNLIMDYRSLKAQGEVSQKEHDALQKLYDLIERKS
jgi:hypothetical protein